MDRDMFIEIRQGLLLICGAIEKRFCLGKYSKTPTTDDISTYRDLAITARQGILLIVSSIDRRFHLGKYSLQDGGIINES